MEKTFKSFVVNSQFTLVDDGDQLTPEIPLSKIFEDSLCQIQFIIDVEVEFKMEIPETVSSTWATYKQMEDWICQNSGL